MARPERSSDVIEKHSAVALSCVICGLIALGLGIGVFLPMWRELAWLLIIVGAGSLGYGIYRFTLVRKVPATRQECPYCHVTNILTEPPQKDYPCVACHRLIHVVDEQPLPVSQVRCGFCNHLNYYTSKSVGLICEECDREIPISTADGQQATKAFSTFSRHDDDSFYDLVLTSAGAKEEEVIQTLQKMLALNRNNVKDMLNELPVTLLTGIPKKKAEMLSAQLAIHGAVAQYNPVTNPPA